MVYFSLPSQLVWECYDHHLHESPKMLMHLLGETTRASQYLIRHTYPKQT